MNKIEKTLTWIDILLNPALNNGMRGYRAGKHVNGSIPSPHAANRRRARNKAQRQARAANYRRVK